MTTETNYEDMFKAAVMDLAEVSVALGIPDQVALTANGNSEMLVAIRRKDARIAELEREKAQMQIEIDAVTKQRDETHAKLVEARERIQRLTFGRPST